ncbi:MAG: AMP-binding protein [Burkholderiaceae bacterium]
MIDRHAALMRDFRWQVPSDFNIAAACLRWADDGDRVAILQSGDSGAPWTYRRLRDAADRLALALTEHGVARGDRVAIVLPQCPETAVAHLAIHRLGAIAMPLSLLFGPEALAYRLQDSAAVVAIVAASGIAAFVDADLGMTTTCPALRHLIVVGADAAIAGTSDWRAVIEGPVRPFDPVATRATDPAVLIYTSGTTGAPKGALMPQCALLGNLSGFTLSQNGFPKPGDVFWSPADWAWTGGLMDALLPTLYFGMPIVADDARRNGRFDPLAAFELMARHRVTNTFIFPTALKMMMKAVPHPRAQYDLRLRGIMSAGEAVGTAVFDWCRDELGVVVNEMFGQTEINYIVGNSSKEWPATPGSIGRPYPGHRVAVLDNDGRLCAAGQTGDIAANRLDVHGVPDPVFFLGYWNNPEATAAKFDADGWCRTGDLAFADDDGNLWYQGRADDMFKSAGYRIGPSEIENCLVRHEAVANAAVVPSPDAERGNVIKAYVVLSAGFVADDTLAAALRQHVRERLAPYETPRAIEFIDALPMTTTGKVQRKVLREREAERRTDPK